jgi:nucleotide-binding universal stress UspA family protein
MIPEANNYGRRITMYKKMLVTLDGSKLAEVVLFYAEELAGRLDLDLTLLNVAEKGEESSLSINRSYIEAMAEHIRHHSVKIQDKTGKKSDVKAVETQGIVLTGHAAEEILRYSDENDIDLILIASHGHSGIRHWALGGVVDKVLRASKVPVWLVRAGIPEEIVQDEWPQRTMLVPLDGSKFAEAVLPHVEALAKQRGAELVNIVLLHVCEPPFITADYPEASMELTWQEHVEKERAWEKKGSERYLAGVQKRLSDAGLRVQSEVLLGHPVDTIIDYANRYPMNLIVLSTHGRTGILRWAYGQVADKVLQRSISPIFLVRPH